MVFIVFGWQVKGWRRLHGLAVLLIWISWIGLGLYVGYIGYCPLTDWHWRHLQAAAHAKGQTVALPPSYIEYLLWQLGSGDLPDKTVSESVAAVFLTITFISVYVNFFRKRP